VVMAGADFVDSAFFLVVLDMSLVHARRQIVALLRGRGWQGILSPIWSDVLGRREHAGSLQALFQPSIVWHGIFFFEHSTSTTSPRSFSFRG
jgi:hypothetical protein